MRTIFTRARWIAIGLILGLVGAIYAQEAQVFNRSVSITQGILSISSRTINSLTLPNATDTLVGKATTDILTNKTLTSPTINLAILGTESVTAAGATETLTSADCGQTILFDTGSGSVVTLPAATGSGCWFRFVATVDGEHSVVVVGNDEFVGGIITIGTTADQTDAFSAADAADTDTILMNQTTSGGLGGTVLFIQDISADNWGLSGTIISTDAGASPLSTGGVS